MYTTLQRLERDGFVESEDAGDERLKGYMITAEGRSDLIEWLETPDTARPPRDELVTKVLVALRVPGVDVHEVIQAHRRQVVELMQQWTSVKSDDAGLDLPFALVVDAELTRLTATVDWLELADKHVTRASKKPTPAEAPKLRRRVVVRS